MFVVVIVLSSCPNRRVVVAPRWSISRLRFPVVGAGLTAQPGRRGRACAPTEKIDTSMNIVSSVCHVETGELPPDKLTSAVWEPGCEKWTLTTGCTVWIPQMTQTSKVDVVILQQRGAIHGMHPERAGISTGGTHAEIFGRWRSSLGDCPDRWNRL